MVAKTANPARTDLLKTCQWTFSQHETFSINHIPTHCSDFK